MGLRVKTPSGFQLIDNFTTETVYYGFDSSTPEKLRHNLQVLDKVAQAVIFTEQIDSVKKFYMNNWIISFWGQGLRRSRASERRYNSQKPYVTAIVGGKHEILDEYEPIGTKIYLETDGKYIELSQLTNEPVAAGYDSCSDKGFKANLALADKVMDERER